MLDITLSCFTATVRAEQCAPLISLYVLYEEFGDLGAALCKSINLATLSFNVIFYYYNFVWSIPHSGDDISYALTLKEVSETRSVGLFILYELEPNSFTGQWLGRTRKMVHRPFKEMLEYVFSFFQQHSYEDY